MAVDHYMPSNYVNSTLTRVYNYNVMTKFT